MYLFSHILYLFFTEESLKKLWKNLKDNFSKCLKKRDLMTRSGAAAEKIAEVQAVSGTNVYKRHSSQQAKH